MIRNLLQIFFLLILPMKGTAQNELSLSYGDILNVIKSPRFLQNSIVKYSHSSFSKENLITLEHNEVKYFESFYLADSIIWELRTEHHTISLKFPNDISLVLGSDRAELQKRTLYDLKFSIDTTLKSVETFQNSVGDTIWLSFNSRNNFFTQLKVISSIDSLPICSFDYPIASMVNALNDTMNCRGLYPMRIVYYSYGNNIDTISCFLPDLLRVTGSTDWIKWFARDSENLLVLLQHPYLGFDHMLYLKPEKKSEKTIWNAELFTYIPRNNLSNLYGTFKQKNRAERFVIK